MVLMMCKSKSNSGGVVAARERGAGDVCMHEYWRYEDVE